MPKGRSALQPKSTPRPERSRSALVAARTRHRLPTVEHGLALVYPDDPDLAQRVMDLVARHVAARPDELFARDLEREAEPDWFQRSDLVGYVAYADRFAGDLRGVSEHLDHLQRLGVTYLHLMPLLKPRDGASDGGYAVASYDEVDPRLGSMDDLRRLATDLHERGLNLCVDLVLNHTAAEHPWAVAARAGDERYRRYYRFFADREQPDRYEQTLREVFPTFAPGNFSWLADVEQWVWTTFHEFQWDLDWSNPDVFVEMLQVMLNLADVGVDVLRLDAVPFMWKREGTSCENLPEVHVLLRTLRALMAIGAPATIFKAEAIVPPDDLTPYLGAGDPSHHECDLAYHNQLMVLLWSSLATGEAQLMTRSLQRVEAIPPHAAWVTYVRCHDDIGWAITDDNAASVGWGGFEHRNFLNAFYSGQFPDSFARGEIFQFNPLTGDGRISGTAASLCGIETALERDDEVALDLACRRLELVSSVTYAFGGVPLLYMGDEIGLRNDRSYENDPELCDDNRWLHRPPMDWDAVDIGCSAGTLEHRLLAMFSSLAADRRMLGQFHGGAALDVLSPRDPAVLAFVRRHPERGTAAVVANFGRDARRVDLAELGLDGFTVARQRGALREDVHLHLDPYGYVWLGGHA
jgi:amylosucrase